MIGSTYIQEIKITIKSDNLQLLKDIRANAYGDFDTLLKCGVFSFKSGVAEVHRDSNGRLASIFIKDKRYPQGN